MKIYQKRRVVDEIDISVTQGEIVGLLGPNGAGKTTTFYMLVGLIPPDRGRVFLDEDDLTGGPAAPTCFPRPTAASLFWRRCTTPTAACSTRRR